MKKADFKRKAGLRMAEGGPVGLSSLSFRTPPAKTNEELARANGYPLATDTPSGFNAENPVPPPMPSTPLARQTPIINSGVGTTEIIPGGMDMMLQGLRRSGNVSGTMPAPTGRPPLRRPSDGGIRGANGGLFESEPPIKAAKQRLGLRYGGPVDAKDAVTTPLGDRYMKSLMHKRAYTVEDRELPADAPPYIKDGSTVGRAVDAVRNANVKEVPVENDAVAVANARKKRSGLRTGGLLRGPGGPESDLIPAKLSNGEYVLPAKTVAALGVKTLDSLVMSTNDGKKPLGSRHSNELALGGMVDWAKEKAAGLWGKARDLRGAITPPPEVPIAEGPAFSGPGRALPMTPDPKTMYVDSGGRAAPGELFEEASRRQHLAKQNAVPGFEPAPRSLASRGLRAAGKVAGPLAAGMTGYEAATTSTEDADANVQKRFGPSNSSIERALDNPIMRGAIRNIPFAGPMVAGIADATDSKTGADVATRGLNAGLGAVFLGADEKDPADAPYTGPKYEAIPPVVLPKMVDDPLSKTTMRSGSFERPSPEDELRAAIDKATSRNPADGAGNNFYTGKYAANVAGILQDRARANMLMKKYETDKQYDTSAENSMRTAETARAQMAAKRAEDNQKALDEQIDKLTSVPVKDKDGNQTGTTVDPELRNRFNAVARSHVSGWDKMSPEERMANLENVRHRFMLSELVNSGQAGTLGKFVSFLGFRNYVSDTPTSQPQAVMNIRKLGTGDMGRTDQTGIGRSIAGAVGLGGDYVEFANGKLFPLSEVMASPELKQGLEARIKSGLQSSKPEERKRAQEVARKYQKALDKSREAGAK